MWLIIGSAAQYHWFPDSRQPKDLDLLTPVSIFGKGILDCQWHNLAEEIISLSVDKVFADPDILFTLKISHAHWNIHFEKTLYDIKFLQDKGCNLNLDLYKKLIKVWENIHDEKHVNLQKDNKSFFMDSVIRKHDHDFIHACAAFNSRPMYERIKPDLNSAWCSEDMFNSLSEHDKALVALEEITVTAIERCSLTVSSSKIEILKAINLAHKQLCTSMTKGWFARYLILNHHNLIYKRKPLWITNLTSTLQKLN